MQSSSVYSALAIILCSIAVATSLKCYVCNSVDNSRCGIGSDVDPKYLIDCKDANNTQGGDKNVKEWTLCRKIVTWVDFAVNERKGDEQRVFRRCGYDDTKYPESCVYRGGLGGRQRTCTCKGEACNSAPKTSMTLTSFFGLSLLPVFIYYKFQ